MHTKMPKFQLAHLGSNVCNIVSEIIKVRGGGRDIN